MQVFVPCSLIHSSDPFNQLGNLLLHAADGCLRLKNLLPAFEQDFDLILIDTQGARSIVLEMALLGAQMATSPSPPDMLTALQGAGVQVLLQVPTVPHEAFEWDSVISCLST